jgi:AraC-like DNA-binding protein
MNSKKYIKLTLLFASIIILANVLINIIIDPFGIFGTKILPKSYQPNERFIKIEYLKSNHNKYDSYIFGSSRVGVYQPSWVQEYIPSKWYNFTLSGANIEDYLLHLKYFIKQKYEIKNLIIQIDLDSIAQYSHSSSDYLFKYHYDISGTNMLKYYQEYSMIFPIKNFSEKIKFNLHPDEREYSIVTGAWKRVDKDRYIVKNPSLHNKLPIFSQNLKVVENINSKFDTIIDSLKEITQIAKNNNINLYIFTTPHHKSMTKSFSFHSIEQFYLAISKFTTFYSFSQINEITSNNLNYYEISHYRPMVAKLVLKSIFDNQSVDIDNFVYKVDSSNVRNVLKKIKW